MSRIERTNGRSRHWSIVSFQLSKLIMGKDHEPLEVATWDWVPEKMQYLVYRFEVCPTPDENDENKIHLQGYVQFHTPVGLKSVKKLLGDPTAHCGQMYSSPEKMRNYVVGPKEGAIEGHFEFGVFDPTEPGGRTDLSKALTLAKECRWDEIDPSTRVRYRLHLTREVQASWEPKVIKKMVIVLWGPTGVGKSKWCWDHTYRAFWKKNSGIWWDGYFGQKEVVFNEFDPKKVDIQEFLAITEENPTDVDIKGAKFPAMFECIIFNSHFDPKSWYPADRWPEVRRRISYIIHMPKLNVMDVTEILDLNDIKPPIEGYDDADVQDLYA